MERLSALDNLFLWLERRQQPLHVAGLQIYRFPEDAGPQYVSELAEYLRQFTAPTPPFDLRMVSRWNGNFWQHDDKFDIDHHFRHVALPKPGGPKELVSFISAEHSNLLDRSRPLWETYLIEAMHGRHFALYTKIHHSLVDGISAMRLGMRMLSQDATQRDMPPIWQLPVPERERRSHGEGGLLAQVGGVMRLAGTQARAIPAVASALYKTVQHARANPELAHVFTAPQCRLTQPITGSRRFAAQSFPLARLKAIATTLDATTNDVILAMCGGALRTYLKFHDDLPERPLVAMVPMSLRKDDSVGGNQVATILANLGTHIEDPLQRFEVIRQSVLEGKNRFATMTPEQIIDYTALTLAPTGFAILTGMMPQWQAFNVVISNVPGPRETSFWNGAQLEHNFPVSAIVNHMALNITLISYHDKLEFGVLGCRRTLPSLQRLLNHMEQELEELEVVVGLAPPPHPGGKRKARAAIPN
jgi:diacylglycerol O-acyltransferase